MFFAESELIFAVDAIREEDVQGGKKPSVGLICNFFEVGMNDSI